MGLPALTARLVCISILAMMVGGCAQKMAQQPRILPFEPSNVFKDEQSARPAVPGTVARGPERTEKAHLSRVRSGGKYVDTFPFPVTQEVLASGRERFNIYCAVCHGEAGYGDGMIVRRGFSAPPSFHSDVVRRYPVGFYFDVITNGYGAMGRYGYQVSERDRWAIVAYIRALQLSQHATVDDVPPAESSRLLAVGGRP